MKRVNLQLMVWNQDEKARPNLPSPVGNGWTLENEHIVPVLCTMPCAPESILQLVRCSCVKNRCSPPCKCLANQLPCTEMCECGGTSDFCDNETMIAEEAVNSDSEYEPD
ncbi:hypothetical protein JTB14_027826 [Gonioctena quinquepunctata]|nr:hypothetical protein JTB14_027826 [Gonioctena quinquepunctata]